MKVLTLTISQFNTYIKNILDAEEFLSNIALIGEVTNFKISGGNAFFDLKDESAMISCVKFGAYDISIKNGDKVTIFGRVNFYVKSGRINFVVNRVEIFGLGALYQQFMMLKEKLEKEGLFAEEIKKPIPKFAKKIGVVTSDKGAVIRDIINVTRSKNPYTDIIVYPSKVQGTGAENEIARGIEYFNGRDDIDTIIVARGGGSLEDLAPFNTEKIVRAIYRSTLPVVSAVGHETDFTLCDFAADMRVPTPSVAAEVAVFNYYEIIANINEILLKNSSNMQQIIKNKKNDVILSSQMLIDKINLKLLDSRSKVLALVAQIENKLNDIVRGKRTKLENLVSILSKQNPLEILNNGYAVLESSGKKIYSAHDVSIGDLVNITLKDGTLQAEIKNIEIGEHDGV